jgi:hypothetical protein
MSKYTEEDLSKLPPPSKYSVSLIDLSMLIYYAYVAAEHPEIGNSHAYSTTEGLVRSQLNRSTLIGKEALEAALYNANILEEQGLFWSPHFSSFKEMAEHLLHSKKTGLTFDSFYNTIIRVKEK